MRAIIRGLPHQVDFALNNTDKFLALVGGYGSGKSAAIPFRSLQLLKLRKGLGKILVISPTYAMSRDILWPLFFQIFNDYYIKYEFKKGERKLIILNDGLKGEIIFRSGRNPHRISGLNVTDFIIDEFDLMPYKDQIILWRNLIARIRSVKDGTGSVATTPEGHKYLYDLFEGGVGKDKKIIGPIIRAKTTDNVFLPEDYIQSLRDQYDANLIERYLNGEFININNLPAYHSFNSYKNIYNYDNHFKDKTYKPIYLHLRCGIDFNVNPMCAVIGEIDPATERLIIFDEMILRNSNTEEMAKAIIAKWGIKYPKMTAYPDLTSLTKRATNAKLGVSDIKILKDYGFLIAGNRISKVRDRLNTVNGALHHRKVLITNNCKELRSDLELTGLDSEKGGLDKKRETPGKPWVHITDAFGYLVERLFPITNRNYTGGAIGL